MPDQWFKLWHELRGDLKLKRIAVELGVDKVFIDGIWVDVLCLAHELDQSWALQYREGCPLTAQDIAAEIPASNGTVKSFLEAAIQYGMLTNLDGVLVVTAGHARNAKPSDKPEAAAERKRRQRERDREEHESRRDSHAQSRGTRCDNVTPQKRREEKRRDTTQETTSLVPSKVAAKTPAEWEAESKDLLSRSWFPDRLQELAALLAADNKRGMVAISRVVRELYTPLVAAQDEPGMTRAAMGFGLQTAIAKPAPNCNYVLQAARGYQTPSLSTGARAASAIVDEEWESDLQKAGY